MILRRLERQSNRQEMSRRSPATKSGMKCICLPVTALGLHGDELFAGGSPAQVVDQGEVPIRGEGGSSSIGEAGGEQFQQSGEVRPIQGEGKTARREPLAPKHKIACWDSPKPLCRKDGAALWQIANAQSSCAAR